MAQPAHSLHERGPKIATPEIKAAYAAAWSAGNKPKFVSLLPGSADEAWAIGSCLFVAPIVDPSAPPELQYALHLRREALLTGVCPDCGAVPDVMNLGEHGGLQVTAALFPHRLNCPGSDQVAGHRLRTYRA